MATEHQNIPGQPLRDPRRWARRILAEQNRKGGRRYAPAVLAMAERAITAPAGERQS